MRALLAIAAMGCSEPAGSGAPDALDAESDAAAPEGPNILRNSSFELVDGAGWATEWENHDLNPNGQIVVTNMAYAGSRALQWQLDAAGDGREYFVIQHGITPAQLQPGHRYALAGRYFVDVAGVPIHYLVRGQPGDIPNITTVTGGGPPPISANVIGQWAPFRVEIALPADVPQSWDVWLDTMKFNGKAANLTIDDIRMVELL